MKELIVFEKDEFEKKLLEFSENFVEYSKRGYGMKLISNETDELEKILKPSPDILRYFGAKHLGRIKK